MLLVSVYVMSDSWMQEIWGSISTYTKKIKNKKKIKKKP